MALPAPVVPELRSIVGDEHVPDSSAALEPDAPRHSRAPWDA
jgi:hypothetical protein